MDDLPKVYVNPIDKEFKNFQKISDTNDTNDRNEKRNSNNLSMKLKAIFSSNNYVYKKRVRLTFKDSAKEKIIIGKSNGYLLTLEGEKIKLNEIYDIDVI